MKPVRQARTSVFTRARGQDGYALAALLVALIVMSLISSAVLPVWKQAGQREKEAELIFRGEQYARAIGLFQRKSGPGTLPPSIDLLVEQKFLRKKYKDPITNGDFQVLQAGQTLPGAPQTAAPAAGARGAGAPAATPPSATAPSATQPSATQRPTAGTIGGAAAGAIGGAVASGIVGVVSKSTESSIRLYNARNKYNEWTFVYVAQTQTPGAPAGSGAAGAGGRGGPAGGGAPGAPGGPIGPARPPGPGGPGGPSPTMPSRPRL